MRAAEACSTETCPVQMKLIAAPLYVLTTLTHEKKEGIEVLTAAVEAARKTISGEQFGGELILKDKARVVSAEDEKLLAEKMAELELANLEVDGDDDLSGSEEEGMAFDATKEPSFD
jgi:translation initiation factor 2 subunit 1